MKFLITLGQEELNIFRDLVRESAFGQYITLTSIEKGRRLFDVRIEVEFIDNPFNLLANFLIKTGELKQLQGYEV